MSKFEKMQRVNVPGTRAFEIAAQGVIVDVIETVAGFPVYALRWLTEAGETMTGSCGEGDLEAANPPKDIVKIDGETYRVLETRYVVAKPGAKRNPAKKRSSKRKR